PNTRLNRQVSASRGRARRRPHLNWVARAISPSLKRLFREEVNVLGWKKSFSQGIGITAPKARTRDKLMSRVLGL
ncbi:hypothetical protein QQP08_026027, partial [Theobroma cacao]